MLAFYGFCAVVAPRLPGVAVQIARAEERGDKGWLTPLAARRPMLAAVLLVPMMAVPMMLLFDLLTLFRHPAACALVWTAAGAFMAVVMGWYWSYTIRMGQSPRETLGR